jgi:hypothetical protein
MADTSFLSSQVLPAATKFRMAARSTPVNPSPSSSPPSPGSQASERFRFQDLVPALVPDPSASSTLGLFLMEGCFGVFDVAGLGAGSVVEGEGLGTGAMTTEAVTFLSVFFVFGPPFPLPFEAVPPVGAGASSGVGPPRGAWDVGLALKFDSELELELELDVELEFDSALDFGSV